MFLSTSFKYRYRYFLCPFVLLLLTACDSGNSDTPIVDGKYFIAINFTGAGTGVVTIPEIGLTCTESCSQGALSGATLTFTLTAAATPPNVFAGWSGDAACQNGEITLSSGSSSLACDAQFDVIAAPTITSVDYPVIAHGGALTISGFNFSNATSVSINQTPITNYSIDSDSVISISALDGTVPVGIDVPVQVVTDVASNSFPISVIHLAINEVDPSTPAISGGAADAYEFVELSTGVAAQTSLSGYTLVFWNGGVGEAYQIFDLGGNTTTDANGLYVIGSQYLSVPATIEFASTGIIQAGEDAIAIYQGNVTLNQSFTISGVIDAIVYESNNDLNTTVLYPLMTDSPTVVIDEGATVVDREAVSIVRCNSALRSAASFALLAPTPGATNSCV